MDLKSDFTAIFQEVPEGGYIAFVEEIPGVNTQGATLDEARLNLAEALEMILSVRRELMAEELKGKSIIRERIRFVA
jgi:predicted RNase H-like HicB family nuclease